MNKIRTVLEWLSLPLFAFLVVHMAGHGAFLLLESDHDHGHSAEGDHAFIETLFSAEVLLGILLLMFFVWLWHRPLLHKLVPCRHTHCANQAGSRKISWPHVVATVAFMLHFFPEAHLRLELLDHPEDLLSMAGVMAFGAHFLVDIIIAIMLSEYWPKTWQKALSFLMMTGVWLLALFFAQQEFQLFHSEGVLMLVGAFFLSMFIHWPQHHHAHA